MKFFLILLYFANMVKKPKSLKILKCKKSKQDQVQVPEQEEKVILLWNIY